MLDFILTCGIIIVATCVFMGMAYAIMNARKIIDSVIAFIKWHTR